jgi:hypothetical protein
MAEEAAPKTKSKGLPTIAIVGIGCVGLLVLASIIFTVAGKMIFSKLGVGLISKGIESKTGIKMNLDDNKGSMTFTDPKTGEKVAISADQKIPDNFPKDFPIYPGSKTTGTISGGNKAKNSLGFWVIFSTPDTLDKVDAYFTKELKAKGWSIDSTMSFDTTATWAVSKGTLAGSVMIGRGKEDKETSITVMLESKDQETPADSLPQEPVSEPEM